MPGTEVRLDDPSYESRPLTKLLLSISLSAVSAAFCIESQPALEKCIILLAKTKKINHARASVN